MTTTGLLTALLASTIFVFNEDDSHMTGRVRTREELRAYVDDVCRGAVTHFFMCPNAMRGNVPSETFEPAWAAEKDPETGFRNSTKGAALKEMYAKGVDLYAVWIERCREKGVSPWISMRMNDVHCVDNPAYAGLSRFWRDHPEYRRVPGSTRKAWGDHAFDYAHPEVRAYHLAFVKTCLERYDVDGFECDWMRFPEHFRPGRAEADAHCLTEFMRDVRALAEAAARRRGHAVKVGARVATDPAGAKALGCDVAAWAREGLVDWIVPCNFLVTPDFRLPCREWKNLVGPKVVVVPGCDVFAVKEGGGGRQQFLTPAEYRAFADYLWGEGAEGLYLFNLFVGPNTNGTWDAALDGTLLPGRTAKGPRAFFTSYRENSVPGGRLFQAPVKLDAPRPVAFVLGTAPAPTDAVSVLAAFDRSFAPGGGLPEITLNGVKPLDVRSVPHGVFVPENSLSKGAVRAVFPAGTCRSGSNALAVERLPGATLTAAELFVEPAAAEPVGEWTDPLANGPSLVVPHHDKFAFPHGFKATVRFSCDLEKIEERSNHANLFTKGNDFQDGYSVMVRKDGQLLVDVKGVAPQYYVCPLKIQSGRRHELVLYLKKDMLRVFLDGKETGSVPYMGEPDFSNRLPLRLGSMGGYRFHGTLEYVRLESLEGRTLPPGGPTPMPKTAPADQARATILWTRTICEEKDRYIGWPSVVRSRTSGDVIAVFSGDRDAHVCPWGKVQLVRSKDGGETWSAPVTIANGPIDDRDAGLVQMPDGRLVVTWFTSTAYRTPDFLSRDWPKTDFRYWWRRHDEKIDARARREAVGYYQMSSADDGFTWTAPAKMKDVSHTPHGPVLLNDGSLLQLGRNAVDGYSVISAWRSTDAAKTWTCLCPKVPDSNGEGRQKFIFHEPNALQLPNGRIIGLVRYHGEDNCMRQTVSEDGGRTWSPMAKTPMLGLPPHMILMPDGRIVAVYGRRFPQPVAFGEYAMVSDDGGRTWDAENEILLAPSHNGDLGYPCSCLLADGSILTVYYQQPKIGMKPQLMATKWRLKPRGR